MTPLFKKLNFKDHKAILVVNSPDSFENELSEMSNIIQIEKKIENLSEIEFAMCFATKQIEIDSFITAVHPKLLADAIVWLCYPKGTSKNYKCEFNRDTGWAIVCELGLESVRMVAIDDDWSALRFRKVEYVKTITRRESYALTTEAKKRTKKKDQ
jgi:hypothetical protein